jgi:hypothetical protein
MSYSEKERPALSRRQLRKLAAESLMGKELLAAIERLEKKGVSFRADWSEKEGVYPDQVRYQLLGENAVDEDGLGVASMREEALARARQDPDFLKVRIGDFYIEPRTGADGEDQVYVSRHERELLWTVAHRLGHGSDRRGYHGFTGAYWPQVDPYAECYQDDWGHVPDSFIASLEKERPSWLEILRDPDPEVRQAASKGLANPAQPEEVVLALIIRRLRPLLHEYQRTLKHERELAAQRAAELAKQASEQQVDAAWSGFFAGEPAAPPVSDLDSLDAVAEEPPAPRHARGAAEMLGDLER